ncbi:RHS repeat protein [Zunongwangia pacifica]|uniref:RHS repeat protein n=1 Tax=Zunongwangia pacifica TaxID=2911062 RepID=A0A9X1ZVF2_9FLAO|nr:RHS repeat protein [Zunongwangia pacifica]MCL6218453.1 RHS repeat protein [Zunongwangia pacifica]
MKSKIGSKGLIYVFLFFLVSITVLGQEVPDITPTSPNAATLGEYGNTPVSLAIGTPNISILIWNIKGSKLSLPISVSYRASGIKIEDQGSNIGLGWALNAGGVITRSIKGLPENGINSYTNKISPKRPESLPFNMNPDLLDLSIVTEISSEYSTTDTEPDLFFYNFGNYSGKFVFDENGAARIMPDSQFKLEYTTNPEADIVITDLDGIKYYFDDTESIGLNNISWYLTKIVSADGSEEISFEYALEKFTYWYPARSIAYVDARLTIEENINAVNVQQRALRLTKINTNFGVSLEFKAEQERSDYNLSSASSANKAKAITGIEIKYEGHLKKKVLFDQEFIETNKPLSTSNYLWKFHDMSWANKRMYLKSIKEINTINVDEKKHVFEYWGRLSNGKDSLANKMSYAQDHWGYYNGENYNSSLRPAFSGSVPHGLNVTLSQKMVSGADRSASFPWSRCGTLKSITYPTGGKSTFNYEAHIGDHAHADDVEVGGLRISEIVERDFSGDILKTKKYEYKNGFIVDYPNYTNYDAIFVFPNFDNDLGNFYLYNSNFNHTDPIGNHKQYKVMIHSGSVFGLGSTNGYHISYREVKEIEVGNGFILNVYNGANESRSGDFTDTYYEYDPVSVNNMRQRYSWRIAWQEEGIRKGSNFPRSRGGWPYAPRTDYSWKRGLLQEQYFYKEGESIPIKSIINDYSYKNLIPVYGLIWQKENIDSYTENPSTAWSVFFYGNYKIQYGVANLTKQTITQDGVTVVRDYDYNDKNQIASTTITNSDGKVMVTETKYPNDFAVSNNVYKKMETANILSPVIEEKIRTHNAAVSTTRTNYKDWGNAVYQPERIQSSKGTGVWQDRIVFEDYYANGKIKEVSKAGGAHIVYLWGYHGQYPIAKIENTTKATLENELGLLKNVDESDLPAINNLRSNSAFKDAMITTYEYEPLVGMTVMTDPRGRTTTYHYDDFGRLEMVKDHEGKLVEEYEYHYKGE